MPFESYLASTRPSSARAKVLGAAAALAISGTVLGLGATWLAGEMVVARVRPPSLELVILQLTAEMPPPPPMVPPPPPGSLESEDAAKPEVVPVEVLEDIVEDDGDDPPTEVPRKIPDIRGGGSGDGVVGGQAGGQKGGIPGFQGVPFDTRVKPLPPKRDGEIVQKKPLDAVMAKATYSPDPDAKLLQATKAARFDKRPGKNTTSFCIDVRGKVVDVKTKTKFPGDPQVDRIIADTIRKWRFTPFEVGGKPVKTCTERTFSISFR